MYDKERLLEEVRLFKQQLSACQEENVSLKNAIEKKEKESAKRDRLIEALVKRANDQHPTLLHSLSEPHFAFALQKQIKKVQRELKEKEREIAELQHNKEVIAIRELESEAQMLKGEAVRLKRLLKRMKSMSVASEEVKRNVQEQEALAVNMQEENGSSIKELQEKENVYSKLKERYEKLKKTVSELKLKYNKDAENKRMYKENTNEIKSIKDRLLNMKADPNYMQKEQEAKTNELAKERSELTSILKQKTKTLQELKNNKASSKDRQEIAELEAKLEECKKQLREAERERMLLPGVSKSEVARIAWSIKLALIDTRTPPSAISAVEFLVTDRRCSLALAWTSQYPYTNSHAYSPGERSARRMTRTTWPAT